MVSSRLASTGGRTWKRTSPPPSSTGHKPAMDAVPHGAKPHLEVWTWRSTVAVPEHHQSRRKTAKIPRREWGVWTGYTLQIQHPDTDSASTKEPTAGDPLPTKAAATVKPPSLQATSSCLCCTMNSSLSSFLHGVGGPSGAYGNHQRLSKPHGALEPSLTSLPPSISHPPLHLFLLAPVDNPSP